MTPSAPDEIEITVRSLGDLTDNPRHAHRAIPKTWRRWLMDELGGTAEQLTSRGERVVAEDAGPLRFDLQLSNRGMDALLIDGIEVSGDSTCAFTFEGPDLMELYTEESSFLRGWYQPTKLGEHQITLTIFSNAGNFPELVVPICGRGVEEAGLSGDLTCQIPPETQPDCPE